MIICSLSAIVDSEQLWLKRFTVLPSHSRDKRDVMFCSVVQWFPTRGTHMVPLSVLEHTSGNTQICFYKCIDLDQGSSIESHRVPVFPDPPAKDPGVMMLGHVRAQTLALLTV